MKTYGVLLPRHIRVVRRNGRVIVVEVPDEAAVS